MTASLDDILTSIKGATQNLSQLGITYGSPGRTAQAFTSPISTFTAVGTTAIQVIPFNGLRRAISFHNCDPAANTTIWLTTSSTAIAAGQGLALVPGMNYLIDSKLGCNAGWSAVAGTGSANGLLILEFV